MDRLTHATENITFLCNNMLVTVFTGRGSTVRKAVRSRQMFAKRRVSSLFSNLHAVENFIKSYVQIIVTIINKKDLA